MLGDLEQISLFAGLSYDQLEEISRFSRQLKLHDGDMLIAEGDAGSTDLYILLSGYVEIISNQQDNTSGEIVLSSDDKEILGEISWLTQTPRTAGVRCHGSVDAVCIDGARLMEYLERVPEVGFKVMRQIAVMLSARIQDSNRLLKQILWNKYL